jgi:SIR2-like domain/Sir2- and TIR-associating SLOG family
MKPAVRSFITEYLGELVEGNAALFAGAGLSAAAGYVDWRELIRPLSVELELDIDLESDLVAVAQFHVNASGRNRHKLHKAVIEALSSDNPPTENHRLLARLPIRTWWTTNYDKLIENALRDAGKVVDVKSAVPQLATTRPHRDATVYKMHGDVDRPDEAVATRDDYERYSTDRGAFITALAGDLVSKTFLFLGFSFTDPNLDYVLSRVRLTFQDNQRRHFAVFRNRSKLPSESDSQYEHHKTRQALVIEDLKRFNIRALLIDDYSEITEFLAELVNRYRRRTVFISASVADYEPWG